MTPDGVHGDERRAVLHQPADVDRVKAVDVLVRARSRRTRAARRPAPIAAGSGDCTRMPSCASLRFSRSTTRQQLVERRRRRQPLEIGAQPGLGRRLQLVADVDLRRRIVADEHDAEARRPPGARGERRDRRADLGANLLRDGRAVEHACGHQRVAAASASRRFSDSGRPSTTSLSPGRIARVRLRVELHPADPRAECRRR